MGTNHSEVAFFIFQNSIGTYQLIDKKQTKYQEIPQSQPASAKLQNVFKELTLWSRKV